MQKKAILFFFLWLFGMNSLSSHAQTGVFDKSIDVGNPRHKGLSVYNAQTKEYTLTGSGYNIWFERDEFQFLYKQLKGDFTVTADFELVGKGVDAHRKTGWMIRESLDDAAAHISGVLHGDGLTVLQWRVAKGKSMRDPEDEIFSDQKGVYTIQLIRKGTLYTMKVAMKGDELITVGSQAMPGLPDSIMVGVFVCSHNADTVEEVKIKNVKIQQ